ncbi:MAG: hypothetical protein ACUVX9_09280 [Anaerolineae bacterium]
MQERRNLGCFAVGGITAGLVGGVVLALGLLAWAYAGAVPLLSGLVGAGEPRDLGVRYTAADLQSYEAKMGVRLAPLAPGLPPVESRTFTGRAAVARSFNSAELTAALNDRAQRWAYAPVRGCQLRLNPDGAIEFSAFLLTERLGAFARASGLPEEVVVGAEQARGYLGESPPIYVRATGAVSGSQVSFQIEHIEIGRCAVPQVVWEENHDLIRDCIQRMLAASGFEVRSATLAADTLHLEATVPQAVGLSPAP